MHRLTPLLLASLGWAGDAQSQSASGIRRLNEEQISTANSASPHYESHLAIDPRDPRHMIAMATVQRVTVRATSDGKWVNSGSNLYVTFDGGSHWTPSILRDTALGSGGDGTVYFDRQGSALAVVGTRIRGMSRTVIDRSTDGGRTFSRLIALPYRDRPWMAFDTSGSDAKGMFDGALYLVGQRNGMAVSRSTDDGGTWSFADHLRRDDGGADPSVAIAGIPGDILVTKDGDAVITYTTANVEATHVSPGGDTIATNRLDFLITDDGGRRWLGVRRGPLIHDVRDYRAALALQAVRSAVDGSWSRWRGRIYSVWPQYDERRGRYFVQLARTDDVGKSWTTTVVSDSTMQGATSNISVTVNKDGVVAVAWYDRRDDPQERCWHLYAAVSVDGGQHFSTNQRLSETGTCTNALANWILTALPLFDTWTDSKRPRPSFMVAALVPVRFPNGGETQGLAADRDGVFHSAWIQGSQSGPLQLWHTSFTLTDSLLARLRSDATVANRNSAVALQPGEKENLSLELRVEVSAPRIDFARGVLEVTIRVVNPTAHEVRGPVDVVIEELLTRRERGMGLERLRVANADNGKEGTGAMWSFSAPNGNILPPKMKTEARTLQFVFEPRMPDKPKGYFMPRLGIYARQQKR